MKKIRIDAKWFKNFKYFGNGYFDSYIFFLLITVQYTYCFQHRNGVKKKDVSNTKFKFPINIKYR